MRRLPVLAFLVSAVAACGVGTKGTAVEGGLRTDAGLGASGGNASNSGGSGGASVTVDGASDTGGTSGSGGDTGGGNTGGSDLPDGGSGWDGAAGDDGGGAPDHNDATLSADANDEVAAAALCPTKFPDSTPFQPPGDTNVHCYWVRATQSTFDKAEATCVSEGGHLVTILSDAEDAFVTALVTNWHDNEVVWIGLSDGKALHDNSTGAMAWITGEEWTFRNWGAGQPDHECSACTGGTLCCQHRGALLGDGTFWDRWDDAKYRFICESTP